MTLSPEDFEAVMTIRGMIELWVGVRSVIDYLFMEERRNIAIGKNYIPAAAMLRIYEYVRI